MSQSRIPEPIPDHLADTGPIQTIRPQRPAAWRSVIGMLSLFGAVALTLGTAFLLLMPAPALESGVPTGNSDLMVVPLPTQTESVEVAPTPAPFVESAPANGDASFILASASSLSSEGMTTLLSEPITVRQTTFGFEIPRTDYSAFTIIPDRPRSEVIQYEVQNGDTMFRIAERFGLKPESIAWANDRGIIGGLRPGRQINILPVDGVLHNVLTESTIQNIADRFLVDPFAIIDSEYNDLFGSTPGTLLPAGSKVVIPGGQAEQIVWNPVVERVGGDANGAGGQISFSPGDPGSCGLVNNPGGGGGWVRPLSSYTWTQGFSGVHTGVDLAAAEGTPVIAANGGTVIFAGWNSYGYGYAIVLAHGPYTTIYGHLSATNVRCGQTVSAGQSIGAVGSTGVSSGSHLHFEIRYNDIPQNPTSVMAL